MWLKEDDATPIFFFFRVDDRRRSNQILKVHWGIRRMSGYKLFEECWKHTIGPFLDNGAIINRDGVTKEHLG